MTDYWQWLRHAEHQPRLMEMAYHYLLGHHTSRPWIHAGAMDAGLKRAALRSANMSNVNWSNVETGRASQGEFEGAHVFLEGDTLSPKSFESLLDLFKPDAGSTVLCGSGFFTNPSCRRTLLKSFPSRIAILQSSLWWVQPEIPEVPPKTRGAICLPCYRDTRLVEENFAWRSELFEGLDLHLFDDNYEPVETERLAAIARTCGWHYHSSGMGRHSDLAHRQTDFSPYNGFIWRSLMFLADDYDYVVKLDTDTCLLTPDWWHEAAARLTGRVAMMGTVELRPFYQVASFWNTAWTSGRWKPAPAFAPGFQGGWYAVSQQALQALKAMGFMPGPHRTFTEDGYMSYCAQLLGVEMLPSTTTGSWWQAMRPALGAIDHLKVIHPLARHQWDEHVKGTPRNLAA